MARMKDKALPRLVVEEIVVPPNMPLAQWVANVSAAAAAFESRWTMLALQRVDSELAANLAAQYDQWHEASFLGDQRQYSIQGAAMVRGYAAAVAAMEQAGVADDAYLLGSCPRTGTKVAIGQQKAAVERVRTLHGQDVIWLTPDEVAHLFASVEGLKSIAAIKQRFPGSEIIQRYQDEPAKGNGMDKTLPETGEVLSIPGGGALDADGDIAAVPEG